MSALSISLSSPGRYVHVTNIGTTRRTITAAEFRVLIVEHYGEDTGKFLRSVEAIRATGTVAVMDGHVAFEPLPAFEANPIANIQFFHADELKANHWNPNVVLDQELKLLERSLLKTKWLQPILINRNRMIIDGFHRWSLSRISEPVKALYGGFVPCAVLDIDDAEAMIITVRINRAKGSHVAFRMSEIVTALVNEHKVHPDEIAKEMGATKDEIELLLQQDVFKAKDIQNHKYSKAWVPAPKGTPGTEGEIEPSAGAAVDVTAEPA